MQPVSQMLNIRSHCVHCPNGPRSQPQPFSLQRTGPLPEADSEPLLDDELLDDELLDDELLDE